MQIPHITTKVTAVNTNGDESQPSAQASAKTESNGGTEPSPEYTEISVPFTSDGEGEFYWKTNKFSTNPGDWGRYINSWNLDVLEINGVDYTNTWLHSIRYLHHLMVIGISTASQRSMGTCRN